MVRVSLGPESSPLRKKGLGLSRGEARASDGSSSFLAPRRGALGLHASGSSKAYGGSALFHDGRDLPDATV
jgi:hypothetical protein